MSITNARRQMEHNHTRDHQLVRGLQKQSSRRARRDVIAPTTRSQTAGGKVSSDTTQYCQQQHNDNSEARDRN